MEHNGLLFHYTTPAGLIGIIESNSLWATDAYYLNDVAELSGGVRRAREQLSQMRDAAASTTRARIDHILHAIRDIGTPKTMSVFVASLSARHDLLSQWRAYCRGGGFAIGFPADQLEKAASNQRFVLRQCIYADTDHDAEIRRVIDQTLADWLKAPPLPLESDNRRHEVPLHFAWELIRTSSCLKDDSFSEEREWRVVLHPGGHYDPETRFFRAQGGLVVPYTKLILPDSTDFWGKTHIVVGPCRNMEASKASAYDLVRRHKGHAIALSTSRTPYREF